MKPKPILSLGGAPCRQQSALSFSVALAALLAGHNADAANANWSTTAVDGTWANVTNWSASPVPGSAAGESATFNANIITFRTIDLGAGDNVAVTKTGGSVLSLSGTNTYTGQTTIAGGAISVASIATNLSTTQINLGLGGFSGSLIYTGTGETTTRIVRLSNTTGGGTITQSGPSGLLKLVGTITAAATNKTLVLATAGAGLDSANTWTLGNGGGATFASTAYGLSPTNTATTSTITVLSSAPNIAFHTGDQGSTLNTHNAGNTNWSSDPAGVNNLSSQPQALAEMVFSVDNSANFTISEFGQDFLVKSLIFNNAVGASAVSVGSNMIANAGLTIDTGASVKIGTGNTLLVGTTGTPV